jgi:hypothetical protein
MEPSKLLGLISFDFLKIVFHLNISRSIETDKSVDDDETILIMTSRRLFLMHYLHVPAQTVGYLLIFCVKN